MGSRNSKIQVGDYVYTTNLGRPHKLQSKAVGPFVVVDSDASTYVIDVDGEEKRVNSDHVTTAPRPIDAESIPHPLLDELDKPKPTPSVADEFVIDKLMGVRQVDGEP